MNKLHLFIFVACITLFSCKKDEFIQVDYIVFGAIQGDCPNGCRYVYYLDSQKLLEDEQVKYYANQQLSNFNKALTGEQFELVKTLLHQVPSAMTKTSKSLFIDLNAGSPNLWYAEVKANNRIYKWTFDNAPSSTPAYLQTFANAVINATQQLQ
ncbi:MAG: hypothetical protein IT275_00165 [Chitinophagales bacterium]|nr:hypothetical protein [Chitinophagales bacterium]HMV16154.1 hypothetical protein [Chitinophagales bacterium]HMW11958.1 hypothetical protein [Chitinophagales bacterium]HMX59584.1 hypothetical protein [Chitinophagales bacterium]HMY23248.1 hypothetical protein [Chitinophagales bacterium]